jgi:hypothetical protein
MAIITRKSVVGALAVVLSVSACASLKSIVVGTHEWFERKEPDLRRRAVVDLPCNEVSIEFVSVSPSRTDYREVEARGCGRGVRYKYLKIGPVESWPKASDSTPL